MQNGNIVLTTGGIVGTIVTINADDTLILRVKPDNMKLQVARSAVSGLVAEEKKTLGVLGPSPGERKANEFPMKRNLKIKAGIIIAVILICIYGVIGIPKSGAEIARNFERTSSSGLT